MHDLLPIAEQLDRVAVELRHDHPVHNRLALVLIDNAVEIMINRAVWVHVMLGGDFNGITAEDRRKARSHNLADRIAVLAKVGELTPIEAGFIVAAHQHRNQAYHEWHIGKRFVRPLCFLYFEFACTYFARYPIAFVSWYSDFEYSEIARKYERASRGENEGLVELDRNALADALRTELPDPPAGVLQDALADDLDRDRRQIACSYRFLIDHSSSKASAAYLLAKAQFDYERDAALARKGLDDTTYGSPRRAEAAKLVRERFGRFSPRYRAIPHGSWSKSIRKLRECRDPQEAFARFQELRKSMHYLLNAVCDSAMRLEADLDRR